MLSSVGSVSSPRKPCSTPPRNAASHSRYLRNAEPHGGGAHRRYSKRRNGVSEEIQRRLPCRVTQIFPILKNRPVGAFPSGSLSRVCWSIFPSVSSPRQVFVEH